jgi:hypothetical protein
LPEQTTVVCADAPSAPSLTVTLTVYVVADVPPNLWLTGLPDPLVPSPNDHEYVSALGPLSGSLAEALNVHVAPPHDLVGVETVGGWFALLPPPPPPPLPVGVKLTVNVLTSRSFSFALCGSPPQFTFPEFCRAFLTPSGVMVEFPLMSRAAAPATCGDAMLVPEIVLYPPPGHVDRMQTPGAAMSTVEP